MKENNNIPGKEYAAYIALNTITGIVLIAALYGMTKAYYGNNLSEISRFMADKTAITEKCGRDLSRCESISTTLCDRQWNIDPSDDVCRNIVYWAIDQDYLNTGMRP